MNRQKMGPCNEHFRWCELQMLPPALLGVKEGVRRVLILQWCVGRQSGSLPARLEAAGVGQGFLGGHPLSIKYYYLCDYKEKLHKEIRWLWQCQSKCFPEMPNCAPGSRQKRCSPSTCTVKAVSSISGSTEKKQQLSSSASWPDVLSTEASYIQGGC